MAQLTRLTSTMRADLVAYLDGELDEETAEQIEQTVAQSEVARREVDRYARVYDLLDELPEARPSADFTQTALSAVAAEVVDEGSAGWVQDVAFRVKPLLIVMAASYVASLLGTLGGALLLRPNDQQRMELLPVAEELRMLESIHDEDFATRLVGNRELLKDLRRAAERAD